MLFGRRWKSYVWLILKEKNVEATPGIEPGCTDLQSAA